MGLGKKTIDDENYAGKRVLVRCDFNVPMKDGVITNDNRINAALPTIKKLINDGAKVILCSHLGKPKNGPEAKFSLAPVAVRLSEKLGQPVVFADDDNVVGENAKAAVATMNNGDVVLLQNTRFRKEETKNLPEFSEELASLADAYVDDAFGSCHRAHCSTAGVTDYVKDTAVGYLMEKEIKYLGNAVNDPERPFTAILGGAKVADKLNVISNLLEKVDTLIIGGGTIAHYLAQDLLKIGFRVRIIEQRKERCDYLSEVIPGADIINGDGSDRDLLLEEGLTYADSLVALTGLDEENIFLALYGKLHSNAKLIAKVNKIAFDDVIDSFGIDSIIYPKYLTADYILQYVRARQNTIGCNVETLYKILDGRAEALEFSIKEDSAVTNVPLMDLNLKDNLLICCINRNGQILTPRGQNIIKVGDTVILVTTNRGLGDIRDILKS